MHCSLKYDVIIVTELLFCFFPDFIYVIVVDFAISVRYLLCMRAFIFFK